PRAVMADGQRSCRAEVLLNTERVGKKPRRSDPRVHRRGRDQRRGASGISDRAAGVRVDGVIRGSLIETVVESIKQRVMKARANSYAGFAVAEDIPGQTHTRLGKEQCAIVVDSVGLDAWNRVKNTVCAGVNAGAPLRF